MGADPPAAHAVEQVAGPVGGPAADNAAGVFCRGLRVVSMDGSTTDVPDTQENDARFGRPSKCHQGRVVLAGPVARRGRVGYRGAGRGHDRPYTVGEQTLARDLLPAFGAGMLVLADRNFLSHTLARDVLATRGAHPSAGLGVVSADPHRRAGRRHLPGPAAPAPQARRAADHGTGHRVHRAQRRTRRHRGLLGVVFALVTDLLDIEAYPALDLACAYPMRWEAETVIGHHKIDMGQGMAVLRSKDPEGVAQEMGRCSRSTRPSTP